MRQTPTESESARGGDESSDRPSRPPSALRSRASSRSSVVPRSDIESSDHPPAIDRTHRHLSKRPRYSESQDETEPPSKRIRLRGSSTSILQTVIFHSITFSSLTSHYCRPVHNSRPSLRKLLQPRRRRIPSMVGWVHLDRRKFRDERSSRSSHQPPARPGPLR